MGRFAVGIDHRQLHCVRVDSVAAIAVLGPLSTALATVVYFRLINTACSESVSKRTHLIPLCAVLVGALFVHEHPEPRYLLAHILILGGILMSWLEVRSACGAAQPGSVRLDQPGGGPVDFVTLETRARASVRRAAPRLTG
jgi:threonine/homoserine efflux transporter RhtA